MSYQIKRTPYFRRMFNNSRRNGQLQRLREEYERIQEFNDRTIELKMRQVRLKRLFREIEDINESPSTSNAQRRHTTLVHMTPEAMQAQQRRERLEALERARELGQEISRRNAQMAESGAGFYLRSELRLTAKMRAVDDARREAQERRQRAARRISYGNAQSRSNLERIVQRRQRRLVTGDSAATSIMHDTSHQAAQLPQSTSSQNQLHPDLMKRAMLQQRLQYGNSRSSNNMMRSQLVAAHRVMNCLSATDTLTDETDQLQQQQQQQQQLQMQLELDHREPLTVAQFSPSSTSNNINSNINSTINSNNNNNNNSHNTNNINNNNNRSSNIIIIDSETEMQTAMLPPSEPDMMRDDDVPTTSQNVTAASQSPLAAARSNIMLHESKSDRASQRWHRIQLTLPWIKVMHDRSMMASGELPAGQLAMGGDELGNFNNNNNSSNNDTDNNNNNNSSNNIANNNNINNNNNSYYNHNINNNSSPTGTGATDNYQSIRGPSLMQEDLMQIMELDDEGQLPTMHAHCIHQAFGQ